MANAEKLNKTYQFIVEHPQQWEQDSYGYVDEGITYGCFAFWAVELDPGFTIVFHDYYNHPNDYEGYATLNGSSDKIHYTAQSLLELNEDDAERLFAWTNNLDDLSRIIHELTSVNVAGNTVNA